MVIKFHKIFNYFCYLVCLFWGCQTIIKIFNYKLLIIIPFTFLYSFILYLIMKNIGKQINK